MGTLKKNNKKHKVQKRSFLFLCFLYFSIFFPFCFYHQYIMPKFYTIDTPLLRTPSSVVAKVEYNSPQDASSLSPAPPQSNPE